MLYTVHYIEPRPDAQLRSKPKNGGMNNEDDDDGYSISADLARFTTPHQETVASAIRGCPYGAPGFANVPGSVDARCSPDAPCSADVRPARLARTPSTSLAVVPVYPAAVSPVRPARQTLRYRQTSS